MGCREYPKFCVRGLNGYPTMVRWPAIDSHTT